MRLPYGLTSDPLPQKNQIILNYIPKNLHKQNRSFWYFHGTFGGRKFFSLLGLILTYWIFVLFTYPRYQPLCVNYWRNYKENSAYLSWRERRWIKNNHVEADPGYRRSNIKPLAGAAQKKRRGRGREEGNKSHISVTHIFGTLQKGCSKFISK